MDICALIKLGFFWLLVIILKWSCVNAYEHPFNVKLKKVKKGNKILQTDPATMENSVEIPYKTGNRTAIWPSSPTAGHTSWGNQNWERHIYPNVHCSAIYNSYLQYLQWEQLRGPSADEWVRKLWFIYTMEYYSVIKRKTFESILMRWMKLEHIIQSEVSQKEKHQYCILTQIYGI